MKTIRVIYNPYWKEIGFQYSDDGRQFFDIHNASNLAKYTSNEVVLQNCVQEIIRIIEKDYSTDSDGVKIEFWGTKKDYDDFVSYTTMAYSKLQIAPLGYELIGAGDALYQIDDAYQKIKMEFKSEKAHETAEEQEIGEILKKYYDTARSELNVVVVGAYSAGKSTFINSLIGEELLPQGADPVTAQISKITSSNEYSVAFQVQKDGFGIDSFGIKIIWEEDHFSFQTDQQNAMFGDLFQAIKNVIKDKPSKVSQMNAAIHFFNRFDVEYQVTLKYRISPLLHICLPFHILSKASDELIINIFDTPGSDAQTAPQHLEVLHEALGQQTNALPIFVINRKDLVNTSNTELKNMLEEYKSNLDLANALVVITRSDEISLEDLNKGIDKKVLDAWKFRKLIFYSAIAALGMKKDGILTNGAYRESYWRAKDVFDRNNEFHRQLHQYAILPQNEKTTLTQEAQLATSKVDQFRHDCGLHAVEYGIESYAKGFLQYLKARQRRMYLLDALRKAKVQLDDKYDILGLEEEAHKKSRQVKKEELEKSLNQYKVNEVYFSHIVNEMAEEFQPLLVRFMDSLQRVTSERWSVIRKTKQSGKGKQYALHDEMVALCNAFIKEKFPQVEIRNKAHYHDLSQRVYSELANKIQQDSDLTDIAKQNFFDALHLEAPAFTSKTIPLFSEKAFFNQFLFISWINPEKYANALRRSFEAFYMQTCVDGPQTEFKKMFENWMKKAKNIFMDTLDSNNLTLQEYDQRIYILGEEIARMSKRLKNLEGVEHELSNLLDFDKDRL